MVGNKLKEMLQDDKGVSPVIGVILMVAVTVVLAAVIGSFVFGLGDGLNQPAPSTQIEFDYDAANGDLAVIHDGGDTLTAANTGDLSVNADSGTVEFNNDDVDASYAGSPTTGPATLDGSVGAGDTIVVVTGISNSGDEVSLGWESPDGSNSQVLSTFEAP
jgi:flagellin-like protein